MEPTTLAAVIALSGLHENTVREHLTGLVRAGLVHRFTRTPVGRGRPAWLYEATEVDPHATEHAGLAAALAAQIHRSSASPADDADMAGRRWGRELIRERPPGGRPGSAVAARRRVVELLDDMGFAPRADERHRVVRLTRCPLLEAAHRYPDVVCGVHLGIVRAALEDYGTASDGAALHPFSEPGACRLDLVGR